MTVENLIKKLFLQTNDLTVNELTDKLGVSKQTIHKVLNKLCENGTVEKIGSPPKTIYRAIKILTRQEIKEDITEEDKEFLKNEFLLITETGKYLEGKEGFEIWCKKRNLPLQKTIDEFKLTTLKYLAHKNKNGIIDGTKKLLTTKGYDKIYLSELFYLDFYAIERFGKTKLGTILHYAKQGQNKFLMAILINEIKDRTSLFLNSINANAIAFVPPTIKREVQIMKYIQKGINTHLPILNLKKISGIIPVPQKSLNKLEDRISNADNTFAIFSNQNYKTVVLIDDAVGSGATMNQIAKKIIEKKIAKKVIGLAVVGSFKGFDVITDV